MTTGAVIFAQNNSAIDYVKMAVFAAERLKKYTDIPVSIITNSKGWLLQSFPDHPFDQIIEITDSSSDNYRRFNDGTLASKVLEWKNQSRSTIYNLTPYDRTLVIDSDYIVSSNFLSKFLNNDSDLQLFKTSCDISGWRTEEEFNKVNPYSVDFYWATVFIFQKSGVTESFFELVNHIKCNWNYYVTLYSISSPIYRNDFAFSIAIHMMGSDFVTPLPGNICFITDRDLLLSIKDNSMNFLVEKQEYLGEYTAAKVSNIDMHVMNKASLNRFIDGGSGV